MAPTAWSRSRMRPRNAGAANARASSCTASSPPAAPCGWRWRPDAGQHLSLARLRLGDEPDAARGDDAIEPVAPLGLLDEGRVGDGNIVFVGRSDRLGADLRPFRRGKGAPSVERLGAR